MHKYPHIINNHQDYRKRGRNLKRMGSITVTGGTVKLEKASVWEPCSVPTLQRNEIQKGRPQIFTIIKEVTDNESLGIDGKEQRVLLRSWMNYFLMYFLLCNKLVSITLCQECFQDMFHVRIRDSTHLHDTCILYQTVRNLWKTSPDLW